LSCEFSPCVLPITNLQELIASNYTKHTKTKLDFVWFFGDKPMEELVTESEGLEHQFSAEKYEKWNSFLKANTLSSHFQVLNDTGFLIA